MSITCEGCGLEYAGARGPRRPVRPAAAGRQPGLPADARRGQALPRARPPADRPRRRRRRRRRRRPHPGHVPRARRVLPLLRPALHDPGRVLRLVLRHPRLAGVPGALPVPVPRQPRDALGHRLARSGARSPAAPAPTSSGRPRASPGCRPAPASGPSPATSTASSWSTRTASGTRADVVVVATHPDQALRAARRPDRRRARGARRVPLLPQRDAAAHRLAGAARPPAGPARPGTTGWTPAPAVPTTSRSATG